MENVAGEVTTEAIKYSNQNAAFLPLLTFNLSFLILVSILVWLYLKLQKSNSSETEKVNMDREFERKINRELLTANKDVRQKLYKVETELHEHKLIMQNIAQNQKETTQKMENMSLIQNKQLTLIEVLLNKKE